MKLEVEIDLTDEQWETARLWAEGVMTGAARNAQDIVRAVLAARDAQRPLQAGDRVMIVNNPGSMGEVLAADGDQVWVKWDFDLRSTWNCSVLRRVTGGEIGHE